MCVDVVASLMGLREIKLEELNGCKPHISGWKW